MVVLLKSVVMSKATQSVILHVVIVLRIPLLVWLPFVSLLLRNILLKCVTWFRINVCVCVSVYVCVYVCSCKSYYFLIKKKIVVPRNIIMVKFDMFILKDGYIFIAEIEFKTHPKQNISMLYYLILRSWYRILSHGSPFVHVYSLWSRTD